MNDIVIDTDSAKRAARTQRHEDEDEERPEAYNFSRGDHAPLALSSFIGHSTVTERSSSVRKKIFVGVGENRRYATDRGIAIGSSVSP